MYDNVVKIISCVVTYANFLYGFLMCTIIAFGRTSVQSTERDEWTGYATTRPEDYFDFALLRPAADGLIIENTRLSGFNLNVRDRRRNALDDVRTHRIRHYNADGRIIVIVIIVVVVRSTRNPR